MKKLAIASGLAIASFAAAAQTYMEVGYAATTFKQQAGSYSAKAKPGFVSVLMGMPLNDNVAVEGLLGLGVDDESLTVNGQPSGARVEVEYVAGAFIRPNARLNENVEVFGRIGLVYSNLSGASSLSSDSDIAYGLGANIYLNKTAYVTVSYMTLYENDGVKFSGPSIGLGFPF